MSIDKETKSKIISYAVLVVLFLASAAFALRYEPTETRSVRRQANGQQKFSSDSTEQKTVAKAGGESLKN